jgi:hypothetical protein
LPTCSAALRRSSWPSAWRIEVNATSRPLSFSASRISTCRSARGAAACRISSIVCALPPRRGRVAADLRDFAGLPCRSPPRRARARVLRPIPARRPRWAVTAPALTGAPDASSRTASIAAAYPAANASRRTSSICCCNSLTAVLAISRIPPWTRENITIFAAVVIAGTGRLWSLAKGKVSYDPLCRSADLLDHSRWH